LTVPTVHPVFKSSRVVIYPNDHRPPPVHAIGVGTHARLELLCDLDRVRLLSNIGFGLSQLKQIERHLLKHLAHLCGEWGRIHGHHQAPSLGDRRSKLCQGY
jgi:hypothetical protein